MHIGNFRYRIIYIYIYIYMVFLFSCSLVAYFPQVRMRDFFLSILTSNNSSVSFSIIFLLNKVFFTQRFRFYLAFLCCHRFISV